MKIGDAVCKMNIIIMRALKEEYQGRQLMEILFAVIFFSVKETTQDYIMFWQILIIVSFDYSFDFFLKAEVVLVLIFS